MSRPAPARSAVAWLHRSRLVVAALVLGVALAADSADPVAGRQAGIIGLGVAVVLATVLYEVLNRSGVEASLLILIEMIGDTFAAAFLVILDGGLGGEYVLLFPLVAFVAGMLLGLRGGAAIGVLAATAFTIIALTTTGFDAGRAGLGVFALETSARSLFYPIFFVAVGLLAGLLGTRMVESEKALARAAHEMEKLRLDTESIVQNLSSGLFTIDRSGKLVHFNHVAETLLARPAAEVRGRPLREALDDGCRELVEKVETTLSEGIPLMRGEVRLYPRSGDPVPVGISTSLLRDQEGQKTGVVALFTDLTEVRRLEQASRRQDRLSVVGGMAASIAHEVRNCVNPIAGSIEILKDELKLSGENAKLLELIGREAEQMERFISELLNFTRGCPINLRETDVRETVERTLEKIRRHPAYRESVTLVNLCGENPVPVKADPEQLEQVFFNIALNAVEAMGPVGKLTISVEPPAEDTECWVEFADTGAGISRETLDRIFEPYYTTKGSGTGLGLAIAHRIVERHSGRMEVTSRPGAGTRVRVYLPGTSGAEADAGPMPAVA